MDQLIKYYQLYKLRGQTFGIIVLILVFNVIAFTFLRGQIFADSIVNTLSTVLILLQVVTFIFYFVSLQEKERMFKKMLNFDGVKHSQILYNILIAEIVMLFLLKVIDGVFLSYPDSDISTLKLMVYNMYDYIMLLVTPLMIIWFFTLIRNPKGIILFIIKCALIISIMIFVYLDTQITYISFLVLFPIIVETKNLIQKEVKR